MLFNRTCLIFAVVIFGVIGCSSRISNLEASNIPIGEQFVKGSLSRLNDSLLTQIRPDTIAVISGIPHPSDVTWSVDFHVLQQDSVLISYYDANGNLIPDSFGDYLHPGIYRYNAIDLHLNTGAYFIRCQVGNKYFIRKALLVK
jgi:hypothetical protein